MKNIFAFICLLLSVKIVSAQKIETWYDYNWKPTQSVKARFYGVVQKTDSGWLRYDYFASGLKLQMKGLYEDSACKIHNGQFIYAYANGSIESIGRLVHNKREGVYVSYYSNRLMHDSATYHDGIPVGNSYEWWPNGAIADSVAHVNDSMNVEVSWFDNGNPSQAGYFLRNEMHGKWKFFHSNGQVAAVEVYNSGKLLSAEFFNEDGSIQADTSKTHANASFKGGIKAWQIYLGKKLFWPNGYQFSNGDMAVVVVDITIGEDGKPENVEVVVPFHEAFDRIALDAVRKSPPWNPRISHNRKVKATFRQPVTFQEEQ